MQKTVLIISGTGMLGQPVSRCLKESGFGVRIMTRDLPKAKACLMTASSLFWFLRGINQVVLYGLTARGTPMWGGLCLVFGLLHLIPVIRE